MKKFIEIEHFGQLYIDRVLFESSYPILFTCKDVQQNLYICVCCQNNKEGIKWLIGKTDPESIVRMLKDEITVRELLTRFCTCKTSLLYHEGQYFTEIDNDDWKEDSKYLPKQDSYLYADPDEFEEEIDYYKQMIGIRCGYVPVQIDVLKSVKLSMPEEGYIITDDLYDFIVDKVSNRTLTIQGFLKVDEDDLIRDGLTDYERLPGDINYTVTSIQKEIKVDSDGYLSAA